MATKTGTNDDAVTADDDDDGGKKETRWDRRRRRRTEEILEVAMRLVMEEGLEGCSLHRISRELDVAVAGLYRYFPSKMALIAALELRVIDEIRDSLTTSRDAKPRDTSDKAISLARVVCEAEVYRQYALDAPSRFALISQIMAEPKVLLPAEMGQKVAVGMMALLAGVAKSFGDAATAGALAPGDSVERSVLFWNGIRSVLQMKKLEAHTPLVDYDRFYRSMVSTLLVGWGAEAGAVAAAWKQAEAWLKK